MSSQTQLLHPMYLTHHPKENGADLVPKRSCSRQPIGCKSTGQRFMRSSPATRSYATFVRFAK